MKTVEELLSAYELAERIVHESAIYRENGESALVKSAWEYSNAENARRRAAENRATIISAGADYPTALAEALEIDTARAFVACEVFVKEYEAYRDKSVGKS